MVTVHCECLAQNLGTSLWVNVVLPSNCLFYICCIYRHAAASYGEAEIIQFLVEFGADVNIRDNDGDTPLLITEKPDIFELLLKLGADFNAVNMSGQGVVEKVIEDEIEEMIEYFITKEIITDSALIARLREGFVMGGEKNFEDFEVEMAEDEEDPDG